MRDFMQSVRFFLKDESGPTSVEYLFMLSLVIFAAMIGIRLIGDQTKALFEVTKNALP